MKLLRNGTQQKIQTFLRLKKSMIFTFKKQFWKSMDSYEILYATTNAELFWNYGHSKTLPRGESHSEAVHLSEIESGIMVELFWNYASKKRISAAKHEKKGAIIPPPRLAGSQTGSGIMTPKNG